MKKVKLIAILMLGICISAAEAQEAILPSGGEAFGSGGSSSYSVGQVVYIFNSGLSGTSNEGVQQPYEFFIIGIDENNDINLLMTAFPNPTDAILSLKVENYNYENLFMQLFDVYGKLIITQAISSSLTEIPMQSMTAGTYFLRVYNTDTVLKTFTIIKN